MHKYMYYRIKGRLIAQKPLSGDTGLHQHENHTVYNRILHEPHINADLVLQYIVYMQPCKFVTMFLLVNMSDTPLLAVKDSYC